MSQCPIWAHCFSKDSTEICQGPKIYQPIEADLVFLSSISLSDLPPPFSKPHIQQFPHGFCWRYLSKNRRFHYSVMCRAGQGHIFFFFLFETYFSERLDICLHPNSSENGDTLSLFSQSPSCNCLMVHNELHPKGLTTTQAKKYSPSLGPMLRLHWHTHMTLLIKATKTDNMFLSIWLCKFRAAHHPHCLLGKHH